MGIKFFGYQTNAVVFGMGTTRRHLCTHIGEGFFYCNIMTMLVEDGYRRVTSRMMLVLCNLKVKVGIGEETECPKKRDVEWGCFCSKFSQLVWIWASYR
mmetsp:Transcript_24764/g.57728  ORF Transcript_24764/g.57728 Transcript_24764/m.57728 type:complete len:99 (+) Transcript_24764:946-1242(+)